jgi:hypothetical protein
MIRLREVENRERAVVKSDCCHYWMIDCSQDSVSEGHCKSCGEQRTFQNRVSFPSKGADCVAEPDEWDSLRR